MTSSHLDAKGRPIVVVTGTGVLTSLGQGREDNWRALTAGKSGIRRISRFPIEGLKTTFAGTVDYLNVPEPSASVDARPPYTPTSPVTCSCTNR